MSWSRCSRRVAVHFQSRLGHSVLSPTPRQQFSAPSHAFPPSATCALLLFVSDQESSWRRRPSCGENTRQHRNVSGLGRRWGSIIRQSLATRCPLRDVRVQARSCSHGRGYSTSATDRTIKGFKFTYMEFCAGIGGVGVALTKLGGICVYANERDPHCIQTYERNHCRGGPGISKVDGRDIRTVTSSMIHSACMLPAATIACAGIPCQPFSNNGNRQGLDDKENGDLIYEFAKLLIHLQNPIVILENVRPFAKFEGYEGIKVAKEELEAAGYHVSWHIYSAVDFNLPQNRDRCFIVAVRKDLAAGPFEFKLPPSRRQNLALTEVLDIRDVLDDKGQYKRSNGILAPERTIKGEQAEIKSAQSSYKGLKKIGIWKCPSQKKVYQYGNRIYHHTGFATCICTREGDWYQVPGPDGTDIIVRLSLREILRLQGFPEGFELPVSEAQAQKQVGNAVPPPIVWWITRCLQDQFPHIFTSDIHSTTEVWPNVQTRRRRLGESIGIIRMLKNLLQRKASGKARRGSQSSGGRKKALETSDSEGVTTRHTIRGDKSLATRTKRLKELDQEIKVLNEVIASLKMKHGF